MSERHARQIILPEVGVEGQQRLARARILVIGAGGLGAACLPYLAGAGVGQITIIDPDHVEQSNLHRQPIYAGRLGQPKAKAAADYLHALDPSLQIAAVVAPFDAENAAGLIAAADLVLDCADLFAVSYLASDHCFAAGKPLISASALGLSAHVGGFCGGAPSLRALFPDLGDNLGTCASAGVMGPVVAWAGVLQAQMALSVLLGQHPSPLGLLMRFEGAEWRSSQFRFDLCPEPERSFPFIARAMVRAADVVIDLRPESETLSLAHPRAERRTADEVVRDIEPLGAFVAGQGGRLVLACRSGLRAWRLAETLSPLIASEIVLLADPTPTVGANRDDPS